MNSIFFSILRKWAEKQKNTRKQVKKVFVNVLLLLLLDVEVGLENA